MVNANGMAPHIEAAREKAERVNDAVWEYAETRFTETKSAELIASVLERSGFAVQRAAAGIPTAFVASWGEAGPTIAFLGEYDALFGLDQEAGVAERRSTNPGAPGHGCGHQALGASALAGALALKSYLEEKKLEARIRYYGCPAEEGGSGKVYLIRAGLFEGVDVALTCHPGTENYVTSYAMLATISAYFRFTGKSAHAGASPHLGRSALDAVELMSIGVNYLREHVVQEARLHYAITDTGGSSPNVVQGHATALHQIRAPRIVQAKEIYARVVDIARGAALMSGTAVEVVFDRASSELVHCEALERLAHEKFVDAGPVPFDEADRAYAAAVRATLSDDEKRNTELALKSLFGKEGKKIADDIRGKDIIDIVYPYMPTDKIMSGSTDVGDVSWVVPTLQVTTATFAADTPAHSWQWVAQGKSPLCRKGMLKAGEVLALTAAEIVERPELLAAIRKDFDEAREGQSYECPIPAEVLPPPLR